MSAYDPWNVCAVIDRVTKRWWASSVVLKLGAFALGAIAVFRPPVAEATPYWVAAITIASELCAYRMEALKGTAQALRRQLDYLDSLGWPLSPAELSDLLARIPNSVKVVSQQEPAREPYFASKEMSGPRRLLDNLCESAWFSKHLSETMGIGCAVVIGAALLLSILALIAALLSAAPPASASAVARLVTALLLLLVSLGLVRMAIGYFGFAQAASRAEQTAERLRNHEPELIDALKAMQEYHVARAGAPLVPGWLWRLKRAELNQLWSEYRK